MIVTLVAATLSAAQPAPAPPAMDHSKMNQGKVDLSVTKDSPAKASAKMDCCKDGCACCAKMKDKPAA